MTRDILDDFEAQRRGPAYPLVPALAGLVVEDRSSGFCGDVVATDARAVTLRDRKGNRREFVYKPGGFLLDGAPVTLVRPQAPSQATSKVTNSGSVATSGPRRARLAAAHRIWVEGRHDAELVEHVWGDDLRELGIVVEPMHGLDDVVAMVVEFEPGPTRRLGILVDHLVTGSKEDRLAQQVRGAHVLVTGHPFVDVWAGVRPSVLGLDAWPDVPRGIEWKAGMCAALGADLATFWPSLRNRVTSFADLRPELVGAVERLIDFVAPPLDDA
ncbi:MAG: DUF3097 family protein [Actinomycetota bacterium]